MVAYVICAIISGAGLYDLAKGHDVWSSHVILDNIHMHVRFGTKLCIVNKYHMAKHEQIYHVED